MVNQIKEDIQKSIPLYSDRIRIRQITSKDTDRFWKYQLDDDLYTYMLSSKINEYNKLKNIVIEMTRQYKKSKLTRYVIADYSTNKMLGFISMYPNRINGENQVEIGYWVGKDNRNKGIATEALSMVVKQLSKIKGIDKITLNIMKGNRYSLKIAEKLGFICYDEYEHNGKTVYNLSIQM